MRHIALLSLLALGGCAWFRKAEDTFQGLTNPLVGLGVVMAVAPPDSGSAPDLSGTDLQFGTAATVMLADAASATDIENAPIEGADVSLDRAPATELGEGVYAVEPGTLDWEPGSTWDVRVEIEGDVSHASVELPPESTYVPPSTQVAGDDLVVDLTGQDYDSVLVVVIDPNGDVSYSNEPRDAKAVYDFTHGDAELSVTVPGSEAFPSAGFYLVGVAGMRHTGASDLEDMNTALSTFMAGKMIVYPMEVVTP